MYHGRIKKKGLESVYPHPRRVLKIQILVFPSYFKNDVLGFKLFFVRKRFTGIFALK